MQEVILKVTAVVSATLALLTAWIVYRQKVMESRRSQRPATKGGSKVVVVKIEREQPRRWPWIVAKWVAAGLTLISFVAFCLGVFVLFKGVRADRVTWTVNWAVAVAGGAFATYKFWNAPWEAYSATRRRASITVRGTADSVFDECVTALDAIDGRVEELNRASGLIHARTPWTWLYGVGHKIKIRVSLVDVGRIRGWLRS